jgi:hypothetical protein
MVPRGLNVSEARTGEGKMKVQNYIMKEEILRHRFSAS